jgi:MFS family permease
MSTPPKQSASVGSLVGKVIEDYLGGLFGLFTCPREIWFAYLLKIMESLCYFSTVLVLMAFLTQDMGLSDVRAGTIFGIFSASMSFFMLFVGFISDSLGIKKALIVGLVIALAGRMSIAFTTLPWLVYPGLFLLSVGFAFMIPLLAAAVALFSTKPMRKFAFSWFYVVMNIGSLLAGLSLDWLRSTFTETMHFSVWGMDVAVRPTQMIFLVAVVTTIASLFVVIFCIRSKIPNLETAEAEATEPKAAKQAEPPGLEAKKSPFAVMVEVVREKTFWIFIVFILLLVMVKMIFQYNHSLYPLYMERIGLKLWTGKLYAINPAIVIFLVPVMTAITSRMNAYKVILFGSFLAAGSVFILGLGEAIVYIVLFQVVLSIGEAIYSPRVYDYTASIAPPGREASYMAYSKAPMFFAKVAAGPATGFLLFHLCPEEGERNTELMWIIVGISTIISPITLLLGRKWLDVQSRKRALEESAGTASA